MSSHEEHKALGKPVTETRDGRKTTVQPCSCGERHWVDEKGNAYIKTVRNALGMYEGELLNDSERKSRFVEQLVLNHSSHDHSILWLLLLIISARFFTLPHVAHATALAGGRPFLENRSATPK